MVCNQKQSVTKIYAQGYQAKDIRNVVQSFNMSRKLEDELQQEVPSLGPYVEQSEGVQEIGEIKGKRRADWSEYLEDAQNVEPAYLKSKLHGKGNAAEPKVVTEMSEDLMFKKPKLKGKFGVSSIGIGNSQSYKPNFSKRGSTKEIIETRPRSSYVEEEVWDECIVDDSNLIRDVRRNCEQQQQNKVVNMKETGASKWSQYTARDDFHGDIGRSFELRQQQQQPNKSVAVMKAGASKWSKYMTEEDGGGDKEVRAAFADDLRLMSGYKQENDSFDQLIEEDIHPDFM